MYTKSLRHFTINDRVGQRKKEKKATSGSFFFPFCHGSNTVKKIGHFFLLLGPPGKKAHNFFLSLFLQQFFSVRLEQEKHDHSYFYYTTS